MPGPPAPSPPSSEATAPCPFFPFTRVRVLPFRLLPLQKVLPPADHPFPKSAPTCPFAKGWTTSLHPFAKGCCPAGQGCPSSPLFFLGAVLLPFWQLYLGRWYPSLSSSQPCFAHPWRPGLFYSASTSMRDGMQRASCLASILLLPFPRVPLPPLPCVHPPFPRVPSPHLASLHQGPGPTLLALWRAIIPFSRVSLFQGYPCRRVDEFRRVVPLFLGWWFPFSREVLPFFKGCVLNPFSKVLYQEFRKKTWVDSLSKVRNLELQKGLQSTQTTSHNKLVQQFFLLLTRNLHISTSSSTCNRNLPMSTARLQS